MDSTTHEYDCAAAGSAPGRGKIYDLGTRPTIPGDTPPLIRLPRLTAELKSKGIVLAKLEFFNPLGSVKEDPASASR